MGYKQQIENGLLQARMPQHKKKVAAALIDIAEFLRVCNRVYVSVSWGKDSIVLAHLVLQVSPQIDLVHWGSDQEQYISNFEEVKNTFLATHGGCYRDVRSASLMTGKLRNAGKEWSLEQGYDGYFVGLTAEESRGRRYALNKAGKHNIFTYTDGFKRSCPLAAWSMEDVTAYVAKNSLQMLDIYERYGMDSRTSSRIKQHGYTRKGFEYLSSSNQQKIKESWEKG